jgi:hypothetical protein
MASVRTNVTLPEEIIREVDELAGPRGRSAYVAEAVRGRLRRDRMRKLLDETYAGALGRSDWRDADEAYRWVREMRDDAARDGRVRRDP